MFLPIRTDSPLRTTPYMNWALILANVVVFAIQNFHPTFTSRFWLLPYDPSPLRFFTYAFLHGDGWHIASNMLFLYIFGNNVNDKMGHVGYLAFYLAGGLAASLGFVLTSISPVPIIGASGAVAAVTGAYLVLFPQSSITVLYIIFFIGWLELPSFVFILLFFLKDLFHEFSGIPSQVAHAAHIFGTLFGFVLSFALLAVHLLPRDQFDVVALLRRWNKRRQYRDMVSQGYNPFEFSPQGRGPAVVQAQLDPRAQEVHDLRSTIAESIARHDLPGAAQLYLQLQRLDPDQVLARQAQLDVANQLAGEQLYVEAAEAYERFLKHYPKFEQIEQVELMLGLIYARYLKRNDRARECLLRATARLHGERELEMARAELARIDSPVDAPPATP